MFNYNQASNSQQQQQQNNMIKFNSSTKFVLGKIVNDLFIKYNQQQQQQLLNENSNLNNQDESANENNTQNNTNKTIYSKYPQMFRYEADQNDRQWLFDNDHIKRKNFKCYLLLFEDVDHLFSLLKPDQQQNKDNQKEEDENDSADEDNFDTLPDNNNNNLNDTNQPLVQVREQDNIKKLKITKKLSPFTLPESILYKINRQYYYRRVKK